MSYKVVYDKNACIGVGQCSQMSKLWSMTNEGKAKLSGAKEISPGVFELVISDAMYNEQEQVVDGCPVDAIRIEKVN